MNNLLLYEISFYIVKMLIINVIIDLIWLGLLCVNDYVNIFLWLKGNMGFEYIG